ncbi:hypothetical protein GC177_05215 [bacterium]|nr:hypothetical protein [bacterium]
MTDPRDTFIQTVINELSAIARGLNYPDETSTIPAEQRKYPGLNVIENKGGVIRLSFADDQIDIGPKLRDLLLANEITAELVGGEIASPKEYGAFDLIIDVMNAANSCYSSTLVDQALHELHAAQEARVGHALCA